MPNDAAIPTPDAADERRSLVLADVLDLTAAQPLKSDLVERIAADGPIVIDASRVEKIGTPVIQLLHAATLDCEKRGRKVVVKDPSPAFVQGVADIGFAEDLEKWSAQ